MPIFLVNLLIGIALNLAATLVQLIFAQDQKDTSGVRGTIQTGGDNPQAIILGRYATAGQLEYAGTWGKDADDTPNAFFTKVISLSDMPVSGGTLQVYVNGEAVTLDLAHEDAQLGFPVEEYKDDDTGKNYLWIKFYDGSQTTADNLLLTKFGSDPDRPWSSSMKGIGLAYIIATAKINRNLFSGLPDYLVAMDGIPLYDPREDTTVGGSGPQRLNDPSTWTFSDNPVVGIYNVLLGLYYDGDWVYGPQSTTQSQLPYLNWTSQMDKCDVEIDVAGGGTQKRFRFGYELLVSEEPQAAIGEMLKACEGRIAEVGGFYKILVGEPGAYVRTLTDSEIVISEGQTYEPFPGLEDVYNGVTATYPEPDEAWEMKEAPARYDAELEIEDGDNRLLFDTEYKSVPYPLQVQRLMEASLLETRRFRKHSFTGLADWWEYEPLDVFSWTSTRNGYVDKQFMITTIEDAPNGNQLVGSQEIEPADYAGWTTDDELPYETFPIVVVRPTAQPMVGWLVSPYILIDLDADARRPGIQVEFAGELTDVRAVKVQVRLDGATDPIFEGEFPYDPAVVDPVVYIVNNAILPDTSYEVRGIFVPYSGRLTEWSSWLSVTTPDIKLGAKDISVDLTELANEISAQLDWIKNGIRGAIENFKTIGTILEEADRENYTQRQTLARELTLQMNGLEASFNEIIEVAIGPGGAIATALESLYAAMGGNTSEVNVKWEAQAGPAGYAARYAVQAAVNDGTFRSATLFMDVPASSLEPTRVVLNADQVVFTNSDGDDPLPAVVIEDGELKFVGARAGRITSADGTSMIIDFDNPLIYMEA